MKCEYCDAMQNTSYEYQEYECVLGIEECEFKDGSFGCRHKAKTIQKMLENMYEAEAKQYEGIVEFMEAQDKKDNALLQAIKEVLFCDERRICIKHHDGILHELNTDLVLKNSCWEIRSKFEELLQPIEEEIKQKQEGKK